RGGAALRGHVAAVRRAAARPGAPGGAGRADPAAGGRVRRRRRSQSGDARRVPHAARVGCGRRGDEHGARGDRGGARGDAGAGRVDHHGPVPPRRARARVGRADHRRGAHRGAEPHPPDPWRARALELMAYPPLDPKLSADALEKQLLATWKHERLFARTQDAMRYGPPFVFYEGPPTANGRPGIHHVFSRTIKDLVCRYQTIDRKSTRLNSSHVSISYAVFCWKKKTMCPRSKQT